MVIAISQAQILINKRRNISINEQVQTAVPIVNYAISPVEGNINTGDPYRLKLYLQSTKEIDKHADKLYISV